jgi:hypothetical protein
MQQPIPIPLARDDLVDVADRAQHGVQVLAALVGFRFSVTSMTNPSIASTSPCSEYTPEPCSQTHFSATVGGPDPVRQLMQAALGDRV